MSIKIYVTPRDNQTPEAFARVLKKFTRKIDKIGMLKEFKQRKQFEKPSEKKRRVWKENARKRRKANRGKRR